MSEYRCSQCGETYTFDEYNALDRRPLNPHEDDPMEGSGYETVCECGAGFHSDKWQLVETVETPSGEEVRVSTVALLIPHGMNHTDWFETCIFHDSGSQVVDRYTTQDDAEDAHDEWTDRIEAGEFTTEPIGRRLAFDD